MQGTLFDGCSTTPRRQVKLSATFVGERKRAYFREWSRKNRPKRNTYARNWRRANPEKVREQNLRAYGLSSAAYHRLLLVQRSCCAVCLKPFNESRPPKIDHDHATGKVRGLLCAGCNTGLGKLGDDEIGLLAALRYLRDART